MDFFSLCFLKNWPFEFFFLFKIFFAAWMDKGEGFFFFFFSQNFHIMHNADLQRFYCRLDFEDLNQFSALVFCKGTIQLGGKPNPNPLWEEKLASLENCMYEFNWILTTDQQMAGVLRASVAEILYYKCFNSLRSNYVLWLGNCVSM